MMTARFLTPAEREIDEGARYYEDQARGLGLDFLDRVSLALQDVCQFPERWPVVRGAVRRRLVRRFPFALLYQVEGEDVVIIAVMHLRRRPDYWTERTRRP